MGLVSVISSNPLTPLWVLDQCAPIRTRQTLTMLATNRDLATHHRVVAQLLSLVVDSRDPLLVRQALRVLANGTHGAVRESLAKALPRIPDTLNACLALHICQGVWPVRNWSCHPLRPAPGTGPVGRAIFCEQDQGILMYWQVEPPHRLAITLRDDWERPATLTQGKVTGIHHLHSASSFARLRILLNNQPISLDQSFLEDTLYQNKAHPDKTRQRHQGSR